MSEGSEFTVLLARQRSGTNALRSVLETHDDICCFNEVFQIADRFSDDPLIRASNYFNFLEQHCAGDITRMFPDRNAELFAAFLSHLRGLTTKPRLVLDVKYNSTHHLAGAFREIGHPTFFRLLKDEGLRVLHLTRRNLLRCLVSNLKAWRADRYHILDGHPPADGKIALPGQWALHKMKYWAIEDELVGATFADYEHYKSVDYVDVFPDSSGTIDKAALRDLASWFGVPDAFTNQSTFSKLSSLPLDQTIENFEALQIALQGTKFESYLEDEPAYRTPCAADR